MSDSFVRLRMACLSLGLVFVTMCGAVIAADDAGAGYIVVFREGVDVDDAVVSCSRRYRVTVGEIYRDAVHGMYVVDRRLPARALAALKDDPHVAYIEQNQLYQAVAQTIPTGVDRTDVESVVSIDGVDDQVDADIAIIDTGISADHLDLNVVRGARPVNFVFFTLVLPYGWGDDNGHGSHVAGTAAAIDNGSDVVGIAPGARLTAVKVLDRSGSGWTSTIISGINWVASKDSHDDIDVANLSLGGPYSQALNQAVRGLAEAGIVPCVAAGNSAMDAANTSPASEPEACTVSALADSDGLPGAIGPPTPYGNDDTFAAFSNFGEVIDICAPGVDILSTWKYRGTHVLSGTSMSSPHAAGAAALYIAQFGMGTKDLAGVRYVISTIKETGWTPNDPEYFADDPDQFPEPLLNVGGLLQRYSNLFELQTTVPVDTGPVSIDAGDIDGDQDLDLVIGNWESTSVSILVNDGQGNFTKVTTLEVVGGVWATALADLDGDGDLDLAVGQVDTTQVTILRNDGTGVFTIVSDIPVGSGVSWVVDADLDGDHDLDLAAVGLNDEVFILLNEGNGTFADPVSIPVGNGPGSEPRCVKEADLDGDGDVDLAVSFRYALIISVLLNNGDGTFAQSVDYPVPEGGLSIRCGDLDQDGDPDLVTTNVVDGSLTVFFNDGNAGFAESSDLVAGDGPVDAIAEDFDQDQDLDLAVANFWSDDFSLLPNKGDGTFATPVNMETGTEPRALFAADFNGDDSLDLLVVNYGDDEVKLFRNRLND